MLRDITPYLHTACAAAAPSLRRLAVGQLGRLLATGAQQQEVVGQLLTMVQVRVRNARGCGSMWTYRRPEEVHMLASSNPMSLLTPNPYAQDADTGVAADAERALCAWGAAGLVNAQHLLLPSSPEGARLHALCTEGKAPASGGAQVQPGLQVGGGAGLKN